MTTNTKTTIAKNLAHLIAVPAVIGGVALGLAGLANAATGPTAPTTTIAPAPIGPGHQFSPDDYAIPAPTQRPGWQGHHGPNHMK